MCMCVVGCLLCLHYLYDKTLKLNCNYFPIINNVQSVCIHTHRPHPF